MQVQCSQRGEHTGVNGLHQEHAAVAFLAQPQRDTEHRVNVAPAALGEPLWCGCTGLELLTQGAALAAKSHAQATILAQDDTRGKLAHLSLQRGEISAQLQPAGSTALAKRAHEIDLGFYLGGIALPVRTDTLVAGLHVALGIVGSVTLGPQYQSLVRRKNNGASQQCHQNKDRQEPYDKLTPQAALGSALHAGRKPGEGGKTGNRGLGHGLQGRRGLREPHRPSGCSSGTARQRLGQQAWFRWRAKSG